MKSKLITATIFIALFFVSIILSQCKSNMTQTQEEFLNNISGVWQSEYGFSTTIAYRGDSLKMDGTLLIPLKYDAQNFTIHCYSKNYWGVTLDTYFRQVWSKDGKSFTLISEQRGTVVNYSFVRRLDN